MGDLLSLVVKVKPSETLTLPAHTGRAVHALWLRWLDAHSASLVKRWHDTDGPKPYTCSSLIGGKRAGKNSVELSPDREYWFRITTMINELSTVIHQRIDHPPQSIDMDGKILNVTDVTLDKDSHEWAGCTTHETLASPYLLAIADAPRRLKMHFRSATCFRQNELLTPVVTPDLVFGSLADRWHAFSEIAINDQLREYARLSVGMSRFRLHSQGIPMKEGVMIGSVGKATYVAVNFDRYWMTMLAMLADFAFYSGVGRLTTVGLGQSRVMK